MNAGGSTAATKVPESLTSNPHHPPLAVCRPVAPRRATGHVPPTP
ncbi:MAG: hypothetical protein ACKOVB_19855 [Terrabacter sp.]